MKKLKRPKRVTLSREEVGWPEEAKAALHEGLNVMLCRNWDVRAHASTPKPETFFRECHPLERFNAHEEVVPLKKYGRLVCGRNDITVTDVARELNAMIHKQNPAMVFVKEGSYKHVIETILTPRWTWWTSIAFWLRMMFWRHGDMEVWPDGRIETERKITVVLGTTKTKEHCRDQG